MTDWDTYYKQHTSRPPRHLLIEAVTFCKNKEEALDLGAGTLVDTKFILDSRFKKVTAIDSSLELKNFADRIKDDRLEVLIEQFRDIVLSPDSYDLISAQYALPFYGKIDFEDFISKIKSSLKPDGVFTGQLFGERDGWNVPNKKLAFQTKDEALGLLDGLKIEKFIEEEIDGTVASGEAKHWHTFHFIAVK